MSKHVHHASDLTQNQSLVMKALSKSNGPLSAYAILEELRSDGLKAPLQVYRALDKLIEFGMVHRLESLNAFVACQHPSCENEGNQSVMFAICDECGGVQELLSSGISSAVKRLANDVEFSFQTSVIELRGVCSRCK